MKKFASLFCAIVLIINFSLFATHHQASDQLKDKITHDLIQWKTHENTIKYIKKWTGLWAGISIVSFLVHLACTFPTKDTHSSFIDNNLIQDLQRRAYLGFHFGLAYSLLKLYALGYLAETYTHKKMLELKIAHSQGSYYLC